MKNDFRILRDSLKNVEIILYDELLERFKNLKNRTFVQNKKYNSVRAVIIREICSCLFLCAQHGRTLMGESPQSALIAGMTQLNTKGVHREVEYEGRYRQISDLTNRNHMRLCAGISPQNRIKSNIYSEQCIIYVIDTWRERVRSYLGRYHEHGNGYMSTPWLQQDLS